MPKNKGKGGKNFKKGKKTDGGEARRDLILKEEGQEYGQVLKMLGDGRVQLHCFDNVERIGLIRGTMRRRIWINTGDIVLIGTRDFEPSKCDVIHKYNADEARRMQQLEELPADAKINTTEIDRMEGCDDDEDLGFTFEEQGLDAL